MKLMHVGPFPEWLRFIKQNQAYTHLYKSDEKCSSLSLCIHTVLIVNVLCILSLNWWRVFFIKMTTAKYTHWCFHLKVFLLKTSDRPWAVVAQNWYLTFFQFNSFKSHLFYVNVKTKALVKWYVIVKRHGK